MHQIEPKYLFTIGAKPQQQRQPSSEPGLFNRPYGLSSNRYGHIFVADCSNNRIEIFDERGRFLRLFGRGQPQAGNGDDQFQYPYDVSVDNHHHTQLLFVADTYNNRVSVWSADGSQHITNVRLPSRCRGVCVDPIDCKIIASLGSWHEEKNHMVQVHDMRMLGSPSSPSSTSSCERPAHYCKHLEILIKKVHNQVDLIIQ